MKPYPPLGLLYLSALPEARGLRASRSSTAPSARAPSCSRSCTQRPAASSGIYTNLMTRRSVLEIMAAAKQPAAGP